MSIEQNKETVRKLVEEHLNTGRFAGSEALFTSDFIEHAAQAGYPNTYEGVKRFFADLRQAFPDFKYTIEDSIGEGDQVVERVIGQGTMKGEFMGMKPSGKHASWSEIHVVRLKDGKIKEHWANVDQMGMLTQLGFGPDASQTLKQH